MKSTFKWSLMLTGLALTGAVAIAQPGSPPSENSPAQNARPQRPNRPRMQSEERRKQTEDKLREMMIGNGVTDAPTQDAVLAFLANELTARRPLRQMGIKLQRALSDKSITDDQVRAIIADYQNTQDLEHQRRTKAQSDLDGKIHYSQNPRLQGLLMLMGVLGDGPPLMQAPRNPNQRDGNNRPGQNAPNQNGERGGGNPEMRKRMMEMFDKNNDGKLDAAERAAMQDYRQQRNKKQDGDQAPTADNN